MRAIQRGELKAIRDNNARWRIDPEALDDWSDQRRSPDRSHSDQSPPAAVDTPANTLTDTVLERIKTAVRIAELEKEVSGLQAQLEDVRDDRDAWRRMAERPSEARPGLFERIFGRR